MTQYTYCPKCDHDVEALEVTLGTRGAEETLRCAECGTVLADLSSKRRVNVEKEIVQLSRIVTAGFSSVQNDLLVAAIARRRYAEVVDHTANGEEFLSYMTRLIHKKDPPKLVIIEVNMPVMNGINAALCLRSIEKGIGREKVPILFFTQKPLDEQFTKAIKFLTPAKYVPLPPNPDAQTFKDRSDQVAELLKMESW